MEQTLLLYVRCDIMHLWLKQSTALTTLTEILYFRKLSDMLQVNGQCNILNAAQYNTFFNYLLLLLIM